MPGAVWLEAAEFLIQASATNHTQQLKHMKKLLRNNAWAIIGALLGAIAGYFYWKQVGCNSGSCAITSKPLNSTIYFAILGALFFSLFQPKQNKAG